MRTEEDPLMVRLSRGDPSAAQEVYEIHGRALLRFAAAMTDCVATAEDVVHDTFVELIRHPGRYDAGRGSLRGYLYGIARHQVARCLRAVDRYPCRESMQESTSESGSELESGTELETAMPQVDAPVEEQIDRAQALERVRAAISDLPLHYREVIALCELEELPYSLVAEVLRCPIGTVRSRLNRARALLARSLTGSPQAPSPAPCPGGNGTADRLSTALALAISVKGTST